MLEIIHKSCAEIMKNWTSFCLVLAFFMTGCMTPRDYGDRAYDAERYNEALDFYEKSIGEGTKDVELFRRAAKASLITGDFASAERYYSQALRYGAGIEVARELAEFYVKTNNFVSAIRVYQYLLDHETDTQPVYNNLGTALMYAGKPFDAEAYLLVAQQMRPDDPIPYLNLGILYDQHLRQSLRSVGFYQCFLQMNPTRDKTYQMTGQRMAEIEERWGDQDSVVKCGEPYSPTAEEPVKDLAEIINGEGVVVDLGLEGETTGPIEVQRMIKEPLAPVSEPKSGHAQNGDDAWKARRWADVVRAYSNLTVMELDASRRYRLGVAELQLGHGPAAVSWLQLALGANEDPATVEMLLSAYKATGDEPAADRLCSKYRGSEGFADALRECPVSKLKAPVQP